MVDDDLFQGAGGNWFTASSWSLGIPTADDNAVISGFLLNGSNPLFINGGAAVAATVFLDDFAVLGVGGAAGSSLTATAVDLSGNAQLILGNAFIGDFGGEAGQLNLSGAVNLNSTGSRLVFNTDNDFTFTTSIIGLGSVVKDGAAVVTLDITADTAGYAGALTIDDGAVLADSPHALSGQSVFVANGASLRLTGGVELLAAITLNGAGLKGKGALEATAGGVELGGPAAITLGSNAQINADLVPQGDDILTIDLGQILLSGHTLTFAGGGVVECDDLIPADSGGVTINGGTTVILADDDLYTGATNIVNGVLELDSLNAFAGGGAMRIGANGVLQVNASNAIGSLGGAGKVILDDDILTVGGNGAVTTYAGVIADGVKPGELVKVGAGVLALSGDDTFTGGTVIEAGALRILNAAAVGAGGSAVTVDSGASLQIAGGVLDPNQAVTINGAGAGGFGALRDLSGSGSADELGDISLGSDSSIACQSALLQLTGIFGSGHTVAFSGGGATQVDQFMLLAGGGVSKSGFGSVVLGPNVSYSGATLVSAGLLDFRDTAVLGGAFTVAGGALEFDANQSIASLAGAGKVLLSNGAALTVGGNGQSTTFAGVIGEANGSASLTKTGAGALTLSGADSYSGQTTISAGAIVVASNGALGAVGGGTTVGPGASLEIEGGVTVGAEALTLSGGGLGGAGALVNLSGANAYGGAITLAANAAITAAAGQLTVGSISGANKALLIGGAGAIVVGGAVSTGSGALTKFGAGKLTLKGADTFTGGVTIRGGTLSVGASGLGGNGVALGAGGALEFLASATFANALTVGSGAVAFGAAAGQTATLTGAFAQTTTAGVILHFGSAADAGAINWAPASATAAGPVAVSVDGGTLRLSGAKAAAIIESGLNVGAGAAAARLDLDGQSVTTNGLTGASDGLITDSAATAFLTVDERTSTTFNGVIAGAVELLLNGAGKTLTLTGSNTYSLLTNVGGGATLALSGAGSVANSVMQLSASATFDISHIASATSVQDLASSGAGASVILGGKSLTVSATHFSGFSGTFVGAAAQASHLTIDVAAAGVGYSLASATFTTWSNAGNTIVINGNAGANNLTGSNQTDTLFGLAGADTLTGGGGVHFLDGGLGADMLNGTGGVSWADYADADAGQTINLLNPSLNAGDSSAGDKYVAITRVLGSAFNDVITGANSGDALIGAGGNDTLIGGAGNDTLLGGMGADVMTGGGGADAFQYTTAAEGSDTITDFSAAQGDHLRISHSGFGGGLPSSGPLDAAQFVVGTTPTAAIGQFLWNSATSTLSWDVDGSGPQAAVAIAVLKGVTNLAASNITLF